MKLTDKNTRRVADYLLIERTEIAPADLCLVFGNKFVCRELAVAAANLYRRGYCRKIAASGGVLTEEGVAEAVAIRDELLRQGVPEGDILLEDCAMHTGENVDFTKALVERSELPVHSVIGVGHISAGRRFLMTLAKRWPEVTPMQVSVNPYPVAPKDWARHEAFRERVLIEWGKISGYKRKGYIQEVDVKAINRKVKARGPLP